MDGLYVYTVIIFFSLEYSSDSSASISSKQELQQNQPIGKVSWHDTKTTQLSYSFCSLFFTPETSAATSTSIVQELSPLTQLKPICQYQPSSDQSFETSSAGA